MAQRVKEAGTSDHLLVMNYDDFCRLGIVEAAAGVEHVSLHSTLYSTVRVGSALEATTCTRTRHGRLVFVGNGFADVCAEADRLARSIRVTFEPVEGARSSVASAVIGSGATS